MDIHAFRLQEELGRLAGLGVRRDEHVAAGGFQRIVEASDDAVGRPAVREHLGVDDLRIAAGLVVVVWEHLARVGAPGVEYRNERGVLRDHQLHGVRAEAAVLDQALVSLPGGDGSRAAADGLEIVVGDAADGRHGREHRRRHAVAARDVLGAALGVELRAFEREVREVDGVEVVAALLAGDQLHAGVQRRFEPQCREIVRGYGEQQRDVVVRTYLGEGAGRVAGRCHHQHALFVLVGAAADAVRLGLLERAGRHRGADGRMISVEGDPELLQPELRGQPLAFIGYGRRRAFEHAAHGQPVAEAVETELGGFHVELLLRVFRTDERGRFAGAVLQRPAFVGELTPRGDALERIGCGCELFHLS